MYKDVIAGALNVLLVALSSCLSPICLELGSLRWQPSVVAGAIVAKPAS